jgi:hypothetical protein
MKFKYENDISKWGIGTHLKVKYIVETTKEDQEIEEINYSNIYQYEFNNLQSALNMIVIWQEARWHNISLIVQIRDHKDRIIMEDSAHHFQFKSTLEKEVMKEYRQIEEDRKELELYREFVGKYKADKLFEEFKNERSFILA